ncbi:MAG: ABC transporter ATP-binding protein [Candidatus Omnitrophica bacterium]|nr:ABC transporter ATP-binding protein [Candidatus Omnitrophota bacterium]
MDNILEIKNLHTYFYTEEKTVKAVEGLSLNVKKGEILGLVGESACGKTVSAYSIMRLVQPPGKIVDGQIIFEGKNLINLPESGMRRLRGGGISMIFQEPGSSLNPLYTAGFQIEEAIRAHNRDISGKEAGNLTLSLLKQVEIDEPQLKARAYPHNLSGGQAQRVVIAAAISSNPRLLIADEPTTSLDVTIGARIMNLFLKLRKERGLAFILITHDLLLSEKVCDRIAVMYAGRAVETLGAKDLFSKALHPYTQALLLSVPKDKNSKEKFKVIKGNVPDPSSKPKGCYFHPRCPKVSEVCRREYPSFVEVEPEHWVSCFKLDES